MVVEHTIDAFESNPHIDEIAIVSNPFYIADFESIIIKNGWKKVKKILKGGQERFHSSLSAIKAYEGSDVNLIFHDAVRPLVSQRILMMSSKHWKHMQLLMSPCLPLTPLSK